MRSRHTPGTAPPKHHRAVALGTHAPMFARVLFSLLLASLALPLAPCSVAAQGVEAAAQDREARRYFQDALAQVQEGDASGALELARKGLELDPASADGLNLLGAIYLRLNDTSQARDAFERASAADPGWWEPLSNLGRLLLALGEDRAALEPLRRAVEIGADSAVPWAALGLALRSVGNYEEAAEAFGRAMMLEPESAALALDHATALKEAGRYEEALRSARIAAEGLRDDPDAMGLLAEMLAVTGEDSSLTEAAVVYRRAIGLDPERIDRTVALAGVYTRLGQTDRAREVLREGMTAAGLAGGDVVPGPLPALEDVAVSSGIDFRHASGVQGDKHLPETLGSGVGWLDYDGDGRQDLYFVQAGSVPGTLAGSRSASAAARPPNVLYRNLGDGGFARAAAGVDHPAYDTGVAIADYDNDGWPDMLVTGYQGTVLYRNNGDGTFAEVTANAGVRDPEWSTSAAWSDLNGDGWLDLYVTTYMSYDTSRQHRCGLAEVGFLSYCHPRMFAGVADRLYRNDADGSFSEIATTSGVANPRESKGLGVAILDLNDDNLPDLYVANDASRNFLYRNQGDFRFEDIGLVSGTGFDNDGKAQAGMGVAVADLDGDGHLEIVVTNFSGEINNLYRSDGPDLFRDDSLELGFGGPSLARLGFGVSTVDLDGDGDQDLVIANGHVDDVLEYYGRRDPDTTYAQPNQLYLNRLSELRASRLRSGSTEVGWRPDRDLLMDVSPGSGEALMRLRVSRGLAVGDYDGDGWPDLALSNLDGPAELLRNTTERKLHRLVVRLRGRSSNRDALGTRVIVTPEGGEPQRLELQGGGSFLSSRAKDLYAGLGAATSARLEVTWPDGQVLVLEHVPADRLVVLYERMGLVISKPLEGQLAATQVAQTPS